MHVTRRVHQSIRSGDAARDVQDWPRAASHYARAVALQPALVHIHVQLGHALKEDGKLVQAQEAYGAASDLNPADREPWLYIAEVAGRLGDHGHAAELYSRMLTMNAEDAEAAAQLAKALRHLGNRERTRVIARVRSILADALGHDLLDEESDGSSVPAVAFDVSDLVPFLRHAKRPTGIQRVQLEVVAAALTHASSAATVALCCMDEASDRWRGMTPSTFFRLYAALTRDIEAAERDRMFSEVRLSLLVAPDFVFAERGVLINLGASWWLGNYFLALRAVQAKKGTTYLPFIHDLIPLVHPEWHVASLIDEFTNWFTSAVSHADAFLVNSEATRRDLVRAATLANTTLRPADVAVVTLDAGTKAAVPAGVDDDALAGDPFILMVGTVEPRKGHQTALAAWQLLLGKGPAPRLVCVGGSGWQNSDIFTMLAEDPRLAAHVELLSGIDDATLAALYRQALFTIYPSKYEGWGLPVTEALCHGKAVVTTSASSLPEAGGEFALYVPPDDPVALAATVAALIEDSDRRQAIQDRIVRAYRPRSWRDIADQIVARSAELATKDPRPRPALRPVVWGCFYALRRTTRLPLPPGSAAGEAYRSGAGWHWPDDGGSRVRDEDGARLTFAVPTAGRASLSARVDFLLRGLAGRPCDWSVTSTCGKVSQGTLAPFERQWAAIIVQLDANGFAALTIAGQAQPLSPGVALPDRQDLSEFLGDGVGVEGFFITATDAGGCTDTDDVEAIRRRWIT